MQGIRVLLKVLVAEYKCLCQCYVLNDVALLKWYDEEAMLKLYVKSNSRLALPIPITESLEGLELELAPEKLTKKARSTRLHPKV
jgi:hypothetical protein